MIESMVKAGIKTKAKMKASVNLIPIKLMLFNISLGNGLEGTKARNNRSNAAFLNILFFSEH